MIYSVTFVRGSRGRVVGMATAYWLDDRKIRVGVPVGSRFFTSSYRLDGLLGPSNLLSNGYRGLLSSGVNRQGREAEHSAPTSNVLMA
jgi:hypothetical protein